MCVLDTSEFTSKFNDNGSHLDTALLWLEIENFEEQFKAASRDQYCKT